MRLPWGNKQDRRPQSTGLLWAFLLWLLTLLSFCFISLEKKNAPALKTRNAVNESSCLTGHIVLGIRLFFTKEICHLTGPWCLLGRSAHVLFCSLKFVLKINWTFPVYFIILKANFPRYLHEFFPHLMYFDSLVKTSVTSHQQRFSSKEMFWGDGSRLHFHCSFWSSPLLHQGSRSELTTAKTINPAQ